MKGKETRDVHQLFSNPLEPNESLYDSEKERLLEIALQNALDKLARK